MKFSIITPTYKRAEKLQRAVNSILTQRYTNWEMIIINDPPNNASYLKIAELFRDNRIKYLINESNRGTNFSRNHGLDAVSIDSDWIIFLDDDDFFTQNALEIYINLIQKNPDQHWIVTNRAYIDGTPITKAPKNNISYKYARDYLIKKILKGDATHCIKTKIVKNIRFPTLIKQGEEWLFFFQISEKIKINFFYHNINTTLSDGYDIKTGLNFRQRSKIQQLKTLILMLKEGKKHNLLTSPYFLLYICMRFIRAFIK